jgi:hypothetical protein
MWLAILSSNFQRLYDGGKSEWQLADKIPSCNASQLRQHQSLRNYDVHTAIQKLESTVFLTSKKQTIKT